MIRARYGKTAAGRLLLGAGVLALLAPAIAGCEAGPGSPTLEFHPAAPGAQTVFNDITISNAFVLGAPSGSTLPTGSSASLFLSLYNGGSTSDALESVTAPGTAASVTLASAPVAVAADAAPVNLMGPEPEAVLKNLTAPLTGGSDVTLTLTFQHAGSVTLTVPVEPQSYDWATYSAPASAPASPTSTATPTTSPSPTPTATTTP